jgi:Flp pilus assembly protein protease CpaA
MTEPHTLVMRRSIILWVGTALVIAFNLFAAFRQDFATTYAALVLTGGLAVFGIGFGIWAARTMTRRQR